jgi:hypoxanthine-DNA glycosylase
MVSRAARPLAAAKRARSATRRAEISPPKQGLSPVVAADARVLLLGSFPGEESLRQAQYYAHPRNQFWRLLGDVLEAPLAELPYAERLARLGEARIGVWDIITGCERIGSLDGNIRNAQLSQFEWLASHAPELRVVAMNGRKAGTAAPRLAELGYTTLILPSSSPAYTLPYADKLAGWQALAPFVRPVRMRRSPRAR